MVISQAARQYLEKENCFKKKNPETYGFFVFIIQLIKKGCFNQKIYQPKKFDKKKNKLEF